jgi:hypothetical protein
MAAHEALWVGITDGGGELSELQRELRGGSLMLVVVLESASFSSAPDARPLAAITRLRSPTTLPPHGRASARVA